MSPEGASVSHNVLIVIPADKEPQQAVRAAIDLAHERRSTLVALVVLDPDVPGHIASTLSEVGFMGEEVGTQVGDAIVREYRTRAQTFLQAVVERAKEKGVAVTPLVEQGDPGEICSRVIRTHAIATAILVAEKRSWLTRFLAHAATVKLPKLFGCEVRVMEED
jgi:nucleotide-binding universal stress UspA family protein